MSGQYGNRATRVDFHQLNQQFVPMSTGPESTPVYKPSRVPETIPSNKPANFAGEGSSALTGSKRGVNDFVAATDEKTMKTLPPPLDFICNIQLGLGRRFVLAQTRDRSSESGGLVLIEKLSLSRARAQIQTIARLKHDNILKATHTFLLGKHYMVAWPFMSMTLQELAGNKRLNDLSVASILGQVLRGLEYLHTENLTHGRLTCSNAMIDYGGNVKISVQDGFTKQSDVSKSSDVQGIIQLTMELVNGSYDTKNPNIGLDDPDQTPLTWALLLFLGNDQSLQGLWSQDLLKLNWAPDLLQPLVCEHLYTVAWRSDHPGDMNSLI